jgi:3,4-dihydroxy 2-butanone 4-phosphate synthase/GTP cyclohydrolase II
MQAENRLGDLLGLQPGGGKPRQSILEALKTIDRAGRGVFVYLRHPRKNLLQQELAAASNPDTPRTQMALREYGMGIQILKQLGVKRISLLSNSNRDIPGIGAFELEIVERIPFPDNSHERQLS